MLRLPFVEIRALMTGLTTVPVVMLLTTPHAVKFVLVQPVKLNVYPLEIASRPMTLDVSVGRMYNSPLRMNELLLEPVVISNSPFLHRFSLTHSNTKNHVEEYTHPKPPRSTSCAQILVSRSLPLKSSSRTGQRRPIKETFRH